jgi:hypothetical protein
LTLEPLEHRDLLSIHFGPPVSLPVGGTPAAVVVADLNGDRIADVVSGSGNVVNVLVGNGDGTFQPPRTFRAGRAVAALAVGNLNADGIPDIVAGTASKTGVTVLLGNGDATFRPPLTHRLVGGLARAVVLGDFNADGAVDVAVADSSTTEHGIRMLLGAGDGTFFSDQLISNGGQAARFPVSIAAADFNGDGHLDLVTGNSLGSLSVLLGHGNGTFGNPRVLSAPAVTLAVVAADFNGDGFPDLASASAAAAPDAPGLVTVRLGGGDGTFRTATDFAAGLSPLGTVAADFNHDGVTDLATANEGNFIGDPGSVSVLAGNGDGSFQLAQQFPTGLNSVALAAGDFNRDGLPDLAVANQSSGDLSELINTANRPGYLPDARHSFFAHPVRSGD